VTLVAETVKLYAVALAVFALLDFLWLGVAMSGFYRSQLGPLARTANGAFAPIWPAAVLVYGLLIVGIVTFVLPRVEQGRTAPATARAGWGTAFLWGALFGVVVYGVYDLTNYATISQWPVLVTVTDVVWGAVICGATTAAAHGAATWLRA
jgi:uncharacterized membrane protein